MNDDLIAELRSGLDNCDYDSDGLELGGIVLCMREAADRITELETENKRLQEQCEGLFQSAHNNGCGLLSMEAERNLLRELVDELQLALNREKYSEPDFSWNIQHAAIQDLTKTKKRQQEAISGLLRIIEDLVEESDRSIEWDEEDPFRMGEWFDELDFTSIHLARELIERDKEDG